MRGWKLLAVGSGLPERAITNDELAAGALGCPVDTTDAWITERTGIRSRRICGDGESTLTMALAAARQALGRASAVPGFDQSRIGCVVCATITGDYATPGISCLIQKELGLPEDIPVFDINAACSGFLYALEAARGLIQNGCGFDAAAGTGTDGDRTAGDWAAGNEAAAAGDAGVPEKCFALVIGAEQLSKLLDVSDRSTCVLFGDGAGAAVVGLTEEPYGAVLGARGDLSIHCVDRSGFIRMDGRTVFRFAVSALPKALDGALKRAGLTLDAVDWVVCHQANERIIDHCVKKLGADPRRFYKNMDHLGNTSAASIPIALSEMAGKGLLRNGQRILLVGFGGGLTWGGAVMSWGGAEPGAGV
ncbi:3-oxoacyl-[acyl-carrier-protein] synthase III C-terminal domain-containing protein [Lachnoclostridium sp. Marseille-P6806]|uniref:3-oxoacyl-[acyl-carrier-protein] synthase III C-terminal domain-containing protein n=1 Tax=Lachnoclostridium sp. Marseille-P6806 TaxID=2364793 RepID=UPI00102FABEC|nr:3-oxoacyl-[acyl-carrier-protein] synthase III C-terminal domain-containing protein [Lachnoclostridium sp. Marseille-P6806]